MNDIVLDQNYRLVDTENKYNDSFLSVAGEILDYAKKGVISKSVARMLLKIIFQREIASEKYELLHNKTTNLLHLNIQSKKKFYE